MVWTTLLLAVVKSNLIHCCTLSALIHQCLQVCGPGSHHGLLSPNRGGCSRYMSPSPAAVSAHSLSGRCQGSPLRCTDKVNCQSPTRRVGKNKTKRSIFILYDMALALVLNHITGCGSVSNKLWGWGKVCAQNGCLCCVTEMLIACLVHVDPFRRRAPL